METSQLTHRDRTIEIHVAGPTEAEHTVVLLHAAPGGGSLDPDPAVTARHGVRLVGVDRPGYGGSSPFSPGTWPSVGEAADDVMAVLDHLGVERAGVCGWSAGGRVAMAAAARSPERFTRVGVISTPAPQAAVPWVPEEYQQLTDHLASLDSADEGRRGLAEMMGGALGENDGEGWLRGITVPADAGVLEDPEALARLAESTGHGMAQGINGMTDDVMAYTSRPWGFEPGEVRQPTLLAYGEGDEIITVAHGEWYAAQLADAELRVVPEVGHLAVVWAWDAVLAYLVG